MAPSALQEAILVKGAPSGTDASRPFRTALIDHMQAGRIDPTPDERRRGANLGLYSINTAAPPLARSTSGVPARWFTASMAAQAVL